MTELETRIHSDIVAAMKRRDDASLIPLRMLKAAVDNARIEKGREAPFSEDDVFAVIRRLVKQRKESAEQFSAGGAHSRAEEETREAELLSSFLPAPLDDGEIASVARRVISATGAAGPSDMGRVMGASMAELKGRTEGERVRKIVAELLASL
ncbi:MAG: GatB/YqeY domain-containing protein [Thermovirgaceae bacterium]|nr:GatB/YqeY domain-containing protein [Thermovirgaceae bacterium]